MKPLCASAKQGWVLLSIGFVAVVVSIIGGALARLAGGDAQLVGIPCGQAVILAALYYQNTLNLPKLRWGKCFFFGVLLGAIVWALATALSQGWTLLLQHWGVATPEQSIVDRLRTATSAEFAFITLAAGFWAPAVEEIYFRGWWQTYLRTKMERKRATQKKSDQMAASWNAILCVAAVFAALHADLAVFPGLFLAGIFFGLAAARWGVVSAIAAHTAFNLLTIIAARGGWI